MKRLFLCLLIITCSACGGILSASEDYQENMDSLLHQVTGHRQGIVVQDEDDVKLNIHTSCYFKAPSGTYYYRWWNSEVLFDIPNGIYEPVDDDFCNPGDRKPLDWGYRFDDEKMYVYNFKTEEEAVAYDFTLQPGKQFTTPDGICWEVVSRRIEVFESTFDYQTDYKNEHIVLCVKSLDGTMTDEWVQYIGSLHYPIQNWGRTDIKRSRTAFFNFGNHEEKLVYFTFSEDPIYGQYVEVDPSPHDISREYNITASEDSLKVSINCYNWFTRHYCYTYRNGNTFDIHSFELGPRFDGGTGTQSFGLTFPDAPSYEDYIVIYNGRTLTTSIDTPRESSKTHPTFDLSGRSISVPSVPSVLPRGVYIRDGKKVVVK